MFDPTTEVLPITHTEVTYVPAAGVEQLDITVLAPIVEIVPAAHIVDTYCPTIGTEQLAVTLFVPKTVEFPYVQIVVIYDDPAVDTAHVNCAVFDPKTL